jgi:uncharacterized protein YbaR (Trm112 family)
MIRLACPKCKKKLGVQEALAGRVAVCPQCRSKFRVPQQERTTEAATEEAVTALPKREPAPPPKKSRPPAPESDDDSEEPARPKRRRAEDDDGPGDEEERVPRKRKKKRKKRSSAGLAGMSPVVVGLIAAGFVWLLCVVLFVLSPSLARVGYQLGSLALFVGGIWCVVIAFQDSAVAGLLCLFVPFYALYYVIAHFEECKIPFYLYLCGFGMMITGLFVGGFSILM